MISRDNRETVKNLYVKLCDRFEQFKTAHINCLDLCRDLHVVETLEMNFDSCQKNLKEFRERFSEWINVSLENIADDEVGSRIGSSSSTSSKTKLRTARANRWKAEQKLKNTEEKFKLEREKRENNILINGDIDTEEISATKVTKTTKATKTESEEKCAFTARSSKSNISSIDSAFQRLASTLQEEFNLPKQELLTFDGKPINDSKFIKNFKTKVESRVKQSLIEDYELLEPTNGYKRARSILYCRSHIIARSYIEKFVYETQINANDQDFLSQLSFDMQKCEITLSQLGFISDIDNSDNLGKIVKSLPMHLRMKWVDVAHSITESESDHTATHPSVNCADTDSSFVRNCLRIIPIIVRGGDGNSCQTYALLDDGADKTLCDERLLKKLNLTSTTVTFHMSTVSSSGNTIHGQEVDLHVRSVDGNKDDLDVSLQKVWSVKKLPISTRSSAENVIISKLAYLADIYSKTDSKNVMLLIGTDSPEAHILLEVRSGTVKHPYAIR
ncbi:unnamed protein product [Mytilus coruscus]|uniref:Peptidase aspartic putative domain-containing protein n=1 Tax=Mytilus coruscus TaxID=42192 RepID=A0A6J8BN97_MYTCO|nr:unnamed protein product [Mytilus coruscus]